MSKISSFYTKYKKNLPRYRKWENGNKTSLKTKNPIDFEMQKKAKAIIEPVLVRDKYEFLKKEDAETFYQTYNIELLSVAGAISSIPITITKLTPFLDKLGNKNKFIEKIAFGLKKYSSLTVNFGQKEIKCSKILSLISGLGSAILFAQGMKRSIEQQQGLIRKSSFDATKNIINDPKMFAILTPEQEKEVNLLIADKKDNSNKLVEKFKDNFDITSSFKTVFDYKKNLTEYKQQKQEYDLNLTNIQKNNSNQIQISKIKEAKENQKLFENYLKNVEHDCLEELRKVETIANISYSALFTGGFLEYLMTDKLIDVLKIKNKPMQILTKLGIPLLTYFFLNKNISNIENKAILATKYKHLKQFSQNPENYRAENENKKQSIFGFIKQVVKDIKEYNKFSETELPLIEKKLEAKKHIVTSEEQERIAKILQEGTTSVINIQRQHNYDETIGIKTFSETVSAPIDILTTALGAKLGLVLVNKFPNIKHKSLLKIMGALIAFIPAAIAEAKFTKEQKSAEKSAVALAIKDIKNPMMFADLNNDFENNIFEFKNSSKIFKNLLNN